MRMGAPMFPSVPGTYALVGAPRAPRVFPDALRTLYHFESAHNPENRFRFSGLCSSHAGGCNGRRAKNAVVDLVDAVP